MLSDEPVSFHPDGKVVNVVAVPSLDSALEYVTVATQTIGIYPGPGVSKCVTPWRRAGCSDLSP